MEGIIKNYRQGVHTQHTNQFVVEINESKTKEQASKFIGKKTVWTTGSGKEIKGKITQTHGNKGAVRVRFEKGLPGQAIGAKIKIL
ncbi:MAG: 50S ribosomal protein L35ae [Candidatus Diapherotrites archaeon]|nr:50S ribosomal protein L35ae [Candidatus Diapherotrites archaeon]